LDSSLTGKRVSTGRNKFVLSLFLLVFFPFFSSPCSLHTVNQFLRGSPNPWKEKEKKNKNENVERNENKTEKKAKKTMVGADENLLGVPFDRGPFFECSSKYSFLFSSFFFFSSFFSSSPFTSSFSIAFVPFLAVVVEPANGAGVKRIGRSNQRPIRHAWISPPNETKKKERREQGKETAATKTASPPQRPLLFRS